MEIFFECPHIAIFTIKGKNYGFLKVKVITKNVGKTKFATDLYFLLTIFKIDLNISGVKVFLLISFLDSQMGNRNMH